MTQRFRIATVLAGLGILVTATTSMGSASLYRISADQQKTGEIATSTDFSSGGTLVYSKTFFHPGNRTYVTFSGQGDTHDGEALLMQCEFDGVPCEVGFGAAAGGGWSTLQKLPTSSGNTNCDDGGGGSADCHDNNLMKVWCIHNYAGVHTVDLKLASRNGGTVFYEKATILIDGSTWDPNIRCQDPGVL